MALKKLGTVPVKPQSAKCSASMNVKLPKYSGSVTRSSALNDAANSCRLVSRDTASGMVPDRSFKLTLMCLAPRRNHARARQRHDRQRMTTAKTNRHRGTVTTVTTART